jgi:hypothetical protein
MEMQVMNRVAAAFEDEDVLCAGDFAVKLASE